MIANKLEFEDFRWTLGNYGLILTGEELNSIFSEFDKNETGKVDYSEVINSIRVFYLENVELKHRFRDQSLTRNLN